MKQNNKQNLYGYIPFIIIIFLIAKFIFSGSSLPNFFKAFNPLIMAFIIIYLLEPVVNFFENKLKLKRIYAVLLSYLLFFLFITIMIVSIIPSITESVNYFLNSFNYDILMSKIENLNFPMLINDDSLRSIFENLTKQIINSLSKILTFSTDVIGSIANATKSIATFFLALFMAFYALKNTNNIGRDIKTFIRRTFGRTFSENIIRVGHITNNAFKSFIVGKLTTCIILGILTYISIIIVNLFLPNKIPYAPLFGLIIGITNIIPYIGPFLGTVPCILISLLQGIPAAIAVLAIVLAMQQVDNIIVSPKILGNSVGVSPFWILASVTIGGSLFGALGMILSVPIMAVIQTLVLEYQDERSKKIQ